MPAWPGSRSSCSRSPGGTQPRARCERLQVGETFDRYRVEEPLGRGGMGTIYRVCHLTLNTEHALKVLQAGSNAMARRLVREGRAQGSLQHPNVVRVTDVIDVHGLPGLIMEFVAGPSLATHIVAHPRLSVHEIDDLAAQILAGVAVAHRAGFVHRDIKPANVLLAPLHTGRWRAKISDFGLARHLSEPNDGQLTHPSMPLGTPAYMAPEQGQDARLSTVRSDIFSLGATLYELATGESAFRAVELAETYANARAGRYRDPSRVRPSLPPRIVRTLRRALEVRPQHRFSSCEDMLDAWHGNAPAARVQGRPLLVTVGLVALIGLLLAVTAWWSAPQPSAPETDPPILALREMRLTALSDRHQIFALAQSPNGDTLVWADDRGLWRQGRDDVAPSLIREEVFQNVDFFPDGRRLLLSTESVGVSSLDLVQGSEVQHLDQAGRYVRLAPDGRTVAIGHDDALWLADLDSGEVRKLPATAPGWTVGLEWAPSGHAVAVARQSDGRGWIEVVPIDGGQPRQVVDHSGIAALGMAPLAWLPRDRLVYTLTQAIDGGDEPAVDLYVLEGAGHGRTHRDAVRVHRWSGFYITQLEASADGRHVTYARVTVRREAHLVSLERPGERWALTNDDWQEIPLGWWSANEVLVGSDRGGGRTFCKSLNGGAPRNFGPLVSRSRALRVGDELLHWVITDEPNPTLVLVRYRPEGPSIAELARFPVDERIDVRCPQTAHRCLLALPFGDGLRMFWLSIDSGRIEGPVYETRLATAASGWDLSPDGSRLVVIDEPGLATVVDLATQQGIARVPLPMPRPVHITWAHGDDAWVVTGLMESGRDPYRMVVVGLNGESQELWSNPTSYLYAPSPSPDGRHVAVGALAFAGDLWSVQGLEDAMAGTSDET